jgi:hemerythrin-like domain-containing protein
VQKAIEVLMSEHRLIERVLGSMETFAIEVRSGAPAAGTVVGDYARFLAGFTDGCHHGKEEDILFRRLAERGMPREAGPLAVMLHEHQQGRAHVGALSAAASAAGPADSRVVLEHAEAYVPLLRQHIFKEDNVLYPMALRMLSPSELDAIDAAFEAFESRTNADGSADRLRALADTLTARFRPDPARRAGVPSVCCGR